MRWLLFLFIAITFAASAFSAENGDCQARLGTRSLAHNILGVITTSLRNGGMTVEALRVLAESESPINPLAKMTPTSINSAARRSLTTLLSDPLAPAQWPETRKALNDLLKQHENDEHKREEASHSTRKIVLPTPLGNPNKTSGDFTSVIAFSNNVVAAAHFNGDKIEVVRLSDREVLYTWPVPPCANSVERAQRRLLWHRDLQGKLWLYSASSNTQRIYFQRMDPLNPQQPPVPIPNDLAHGYIADLKGYAGDFVVVKVRSTEMTSQYFNLSGGKLEDLTQAFLNAATTIHPLPVGAAISVRTEIDAPALVYVTHQGKFLLEADKKILRVTDLRNRRQVQPLEFDLPSVGGVVSTTIDCYETNDGRIFFAVGQQEGLAAHYAFYSLDTGKHPIYLLKASGRVTSNQWFQGLSGEPLFGYSTGFGTDVVLHVVDHEARSVPVPEYRVGIGRGGWSSVDGRTFFTLIGNDGKLQVLDLFGEVPK